MVRRIREVAPSGRPCDSDRRFFENRYYNHSDHRVSLRALMPPTRAAGNPHYFPEHLRDGLE